MQTHRSKHGRAKRKTRFNAIVIRQTPNLDSLFSRCFIREERTGTPADLQTAYISHRLTTLPWSRSLPLSPARDRCMNERMHRAFFTTGWQSNQDFERVQRRNNERKRTSARRNGFQFQRENARFYTLVLILSRWTDNKLPIQDRTSIRDVVKKTTHRISVLSLSLISFVPSQTVSSSTLLQRTYCYSRGESRGWARH